MDSTPPARSFDVLDLSAETRRSLETMTYATPTEVQFEAIPRALAGIDGRPAMTLRIDVPREVSARGRDEISFALVSILVAGALATLVLVLALRGMVLWPVRRMTRHAVAIASADDLTQRMRIERSDELGVLAREFDRMVDQLADTRRRLDQSGRAPAAMIMSFLRSVMSR